MKKHNLHSLFLFTVSLLFISCSNLFNKAAPDSFVPETGTVILTIDSPYENISDSRAAVPDVSNKTGLNKQISFIKKDGSVYEDENLILTEKNGAYEVSGIPLNLELKIKIKLVKESDSTLKMEGESNYFSLTKVNPVVSERIELFPVVTATGKGSIKLPIVNSTSTFTVNSFSYVMDNNSESSKTAVPSYFQINEISSGTHTFVFKFWNYSNSKYTLLYEVVEAINVYDSYETNLWLSAGNCPWLANDSGVLKLKLTDSLISNFEETTLYVDPNATTSTESGTYYNPYKKIQSAVNRICDYGSSSKSYTIYLKNNINANSTIITNDGANGKSIVKIAPSSNRDITIAGYNTTKTIDANQLSRHFYINEKAQVTLKNLELTKGSAGSLGGGSIYSQTPLTLDNVKITSSDVSKTGLNGNNVYVTSGNLLTLKKGTYLTGDVYLESRAMVSFSSDYDKQKNLVITPSLYNTTTKVINNVTGFTSSVLLKCKITPESSPVKNWAVDSNGYLSAGYPASAFTSAPVSTEHPVIEVSSNTDLDKIKTWVDGGATLQGITITLKNDINYYNKTFAGIGSTSKPFKGILDGNTKSINNIKIEDGFIKRLEGGKIKNLSIQGTSSGSGFVSRMTTGAIENCVSKINITVTGSGQDYQYVGGFVGRIENYSSIGNYDCSIKNCTNEGTITSSEQYVGGICGGIGGKYSYKVEIDSCSNTKPITTSQYYAGGICGYAMGRIINCDNRGDITAERNVGGIAGAYSVWEIMYDIVGIINCYNTATINGTGSSVNSIGGILGHIAFESGINAVIRLCNCYSRGSATGGSSNGQILGSLSDTSCDVANDDRLEIEYNYFKGSANSEGIAMLRNKIGSNDFFYTINYTTLPEPIYMNSKFSKDVSTLLTLYAGSSYKKWNVTASGVSFQ